MSPLLTQSRHVIASFGMSSEALGNKRRKDVQEDYCGEEESEMGIALEAGGRDSEGFRADKKVECEKLELAGRSRASRHEAFQSWLPRTKSYRRASQDFSVCCRGVAQDW